MCRHHDISCCHPAHHAHSGAAYHHGGCCCSGHGHPVRQPTREEVVAQLEQYLHDLQAEAKAVEQRIADMKKTG